MAEKEVKKVCSTSNKVQADMILDMLKQNQIAAYPVSKEAGEIMEICSSISFAGYDIFCAVQDYDRAKELIDALNQNIRSNTTEGMTTYHFSKYTRVIAMILVLVIVAIVLAGIFF